jgi:hypothetical protein
MAKNRPPCPRPQKGMPVDNVAMVKCLAATDEQCPPCVEAPRNNKVGDEPRREQPPEANCVHGRGVHGQ